MAFKFKGVDFIQFDGLLSGDEMLARATTRQFVEDNVIPIIEQCNRDGRFPRELIKPMGQLGFFGANIEGYGCAGMSNVEYGLVMQELERGASGLRSFVSVQPARSLSPSSPSAATHRRTRGCHSWRREKSSAASGLPSRTTAQT